METKPFSANEILLNSIAPQPAQPVAETPTTSPETPIKDEVKVEEPVTVTPEVPSTEVSIEDWDTPPATETKPEKPSWDFDSFVKDLGIEAKDVSELKEKIKSKPAEDVWQGVDENLKKAVEFAKKGGDYLALLKVQSVDYSKIDATQLYESSVLGNPAYSAEEAHELLDSMSPLQRKERGLQLRDEYMRYQKAQIDQFENSLRAAEQSKAEKKTRADKELQSNLDKVEKIAGLKVQPHHKKDIYEAITTGRMQQDLFFNPESGDYDYNKMIQTTFVMKNLDKIIGHLEKITKSDTLRGFHKEISNASIDKSKEAPVPTVETNYDPLGDFVKRSQAGKR